MVREFRRWVGYTPCSMQEPAFNATATAAALDAPRAPDAHADVEATMRRPRGRGRPTTSVLLRGGYTTNTNALAEVAEVAEAAAAPEWDGQANGSRGRARTRSLCSRSAARAAGCSESSSNAGGGRLAKRNKSSGPFGRATRERPGLGAGAGVGTASATSGTGGTRAAHQKAPWGAGPGKGYARDRAQAWAKAHLAAGGGAGRCGTSAGTGSRRNRVRARRGHVGASGCCGGHNKVGRRPAKSSGSGRRTAAGNRRASRHDSRVNPPGRGRAARQRSRGVAASALDVTWDVLDAQGYPELTPRHRRKLFPSSTVVVPAVRAEPSAVSPGSNGDHGGGARGGGRTDRVVEMMVSLEQAVMDVCKVRFGYIVKRLLHQYTHEREKR